MTVRIIEGGGGAAAAHYGIALARFDVPIGERLLAGALRALRGGGVPDSRITVVGVPGAFELPLAVGRMAAGGRFDALIALGAVIRGGTAHFEHVAGACARGLGRVSLDSGLPVAFGVLTVDDRRQAMERSGGDERNKGAEAARAAMEMVGVLRRLDG